MNPTLIAASAALLLCCSHANANEYAALMQAKKFAEVERAAAAKLTREPTNAPALVARSIALAAIGNQAHIPDAINSAQQCVRSHPANADCHVTLGKALGWKAMAGGMLSAMGYAGDIRDAFKQGVELDPRNLDARFSLLQYYMMAPAIAGGGNGKAQDMVGATTGLAPEAAKVMQAMLDVNTGNLARAESIANTVRPGSDEQLRARHEALLASIAGTYLNQKKLTDMERGVQAALRHYPASEHANFLGARLRQEQGRQRDALVGFEALLARQTRSYILYRMGQSHQALGDKARAVAAFEQAIAGLPTLNAKQKSDAHSQLAILKG